MRLFLRIFKLGVLPLGYILTTVGIYSAYKEVSALGIAPWLWYLIGLLLLTAGFVVIIIGLLPKSNPIHILDSSFYVDDLDIKKTQIVARLTVMSTRDVVLSNYIEIYLPKVIVEKVRKVIYIPEPYAFFLDKEHQFEFVTLKANEPKNFKIDKPMTLLSENTDNIKRAIKKFRSELLKTGYTIRYFPALNKARLYQEKGQELL